MRASRKKGKEQTARGKRLFPSAIAIGTSSSAVDFVAEHISGAEGIYSEKQILAIVRRYISRARNHPRGKPDSIFLTIEKIRQKPQPLSALPVATVQCGSTLRASSLISSLLGSSGVSARAMASAFNIVQGKNIMRGAALIFARSGRRAEPDRQRGVRASRLGITRGAEKALAAGLREQGINTQTVREALILASKVASCHDVVAELCVSDDPDYTTGYVSSRARGYIRIPHVKKRGDRRGGRVFFLEEGAHLLSVITYIEEVPVIINKVSPCRGICTVDEITGHHQ